MQISKPSMDAETARRNSPAAAAGHRQRTPQRRRGRSGERRVSPPGREPWPRRWRDRRAAVEVLEVPGRNHFTIVEELAREGVLLGRALALLEQP